MSACWKFINISLSIASCKAAKPKGHREQMLSLLATEIIVFSPLKDIIFGRQYQKANFFTEI